MRTMEPQVSFADLAFMSQGIELNPVLEAILEVLDEQDELFEAVRADLERGLKNPHTGRGGLTPRQVLFSLVLMRVKNWTYRELRERIADGYTLRRFTSFYSQPVPKHDAFNRSHNRLTPATLRAINDMVVEGAVDAGLEDGQKLRVDTTVVETNIHWPTDATLLWDTVRVLTRCVRRLGEILPAGVPGFTNRTRTARRRMQKLQRMSAVQRRRRQVPTYRELIRTTQHVVDNSRQVLEKTQYARGTDPLDDVAIAALRADITHYSQLGDRVMDQTRRRVLDGEQVPAGEKIYSIFEPHTDLIKRGKAQKPVEFGHKVFLAESAQGLITQYRVLDGNPSDEDHVELSLKRHRDMFGFAPHLFATDRGFHSPHNQDACHQAGVACECIPQRGGQKTPERQAYEKTPAFKKGQRFRAGIEGRISVLFRGRGMKRCLAQGRERFELLVGAAVLANNLMKIADLLIKKRKPKRRAA